MEARKKFSRKRKMSIFSDPNIGVGKAIAVFTSGGDSQGRMENKKLDLFIKKLK